MAYYMIFDNKKWYEGLMPNYIGKSIKAPRTYIHAYQLYKWGKKHNELSVIDDPELGFSSTLPQDGDIVLAQFIQNNDIYLYFAKDDGYATAIKLSDLIQNGGVSASLTHVCHALSLVRKVLSMAIEKMKFQLKDWYEGTQPYYVGQTIKGVKSNLANFTLISTAESIYFDTYYWKTDYDVSTLSASQVNGQKVLYQVTSTTNYLHAPNPSQVFLGFSLKHIYDRHSYQYVDVMCWVKLNDILQNGGVSSSPLTHVWQCLRSLLRNEVVVC